MGFQVGDEVSWTSHSNQRVKTKQGFIVEEVPPWERPPVEGAGGGRNHTSYVVGVEDRGSVRFYWPVASKLRKVRNE